MSCGHFDSTEDPELRAKLDEAKRRLPLLKSPEYPKYPKPRECLGSPKHRESPESPESPECPKFPVSPVHTDKSRTKTYLRRKTLKAWRSAMLARHATRRGHNGFSCCVT